MKRFRFRIYDEHGLVAEERVFQATNEAVAVMLTSGWRDGRRCEVLHGSEQVVSWE
jgi:hypothetical protein